jgi:hypothetical protein
MQSAKENDEPVDEAPIHGISVQADAASSEAAATGTKWRQLRSSSSHSRPKLEPSSSGSLPLAR